MGEQGISIKNCLNQKFPLGIILERGLEATLRSKRMFWVFENDNFGFLCKFLSNKIEAIFIRKQDKVLKTV